MEGQEGDMSEIIIREATTADVADIQRLAHLLARFEFESGLAQDIDPQWAFTEAGVSYIRRQLAGEDSIAIVATCDGEVVGFLGGGIRQEKGSPVGGLQGVFVLPAFRRRKVGARLVAHFLQWCELQNLNKASVAVAPANDAAISLYATMGFEASTLILERRV
jgi:GNAT superfamily N-acetyltransferase